MKDLELFDEDYCRRRGVERGVLEQVVTLAIEIAREGREGRKIGTLFVVADSDAVMKRSKPLILDPLLGHPPERKRIQDPNLRETIKELAQLDGAFVFSNTGVAISGCRYISASSAGIELPLGLGSRHMAAASITAESAAVAVVVSESTMVRIFDDGQLISEIIPELWMLRRHSTQIHGAASQHTEDQVTIVNKEEQ
jgi:DNA integrity scanning protein DisA with diadenylate cyclase activity